MIRNRDRKAPAKPGRFSGALYRIAHNRCVDVPAEVSAAIGTKGRIPVRAEVLGDSFESTLVPRGGGLHRLFIPAEICRRHGFEWGDAVPVLLRKAKAVAGRAEAPPELRAAASKTPEAIAAYARLSPSDRRQITKYFASARSPETRKARAARVARLLVTRAPAVRE